MRGRFYWLSAKKLARIPRVQVMLLLSFGNCGIALVRKMKF